MARLRQAGVYVLRNTADGKVYVGSSKRIQQREWEHWKELRQGTHHNTHLQAAYERQPEAFRFEVLEICSPEDLSDREQFWADFFRAHDRRYGYNSRPTVDRNDGITRSEATRQKLRDARLGTKAPWNERVWRGRRHSEETKAKLSAVLTGRTRSPEATEKQRQKMLGFRHTEESKQIMRAKATGKKHSPETCQKMRAARLGTGIGPDNPFYGRTHSEETRAKMRAAWVRRKARQQP